LAEKSIWVAFEYGYFWKRKKGKNIYILSHPKTVLYSPFSILQSKSMADSDQLRIFFKEICHSFKQEYQGHADIDTLIEIAIRLPVLSSEERKLQADLVLRMGSTDNATALNAVRELRNRGWLENGSLRGKVFTKANLQGVDLTRADLQGSKLNWANLKEADLTYDKEQI
jgi:hypothetical protein